MGRARLCALVAALLLLPGLAVSQTVVTCGSACTVTMVLSASTVTGTVTAAFPDMTADQVADYMQLWGLFLGLGVVVLCMKALYARFKLSKYEG